MIENGFNSTPLFLADAILLGYAAHVPSILKSAFYELHIRSSRTQEAHVYEKTGGIYDAYKPTWDRQLYSGLEASHMLQIMEGRDWLVATIATLSITAIPKNLVQCDSYNQDTKKACQSHQMNWLGVDSSAGPGYITSLYDNPLDALQQLERDIRETVEENGICALCGKRVCAQLEGLRQYIWDELPLFFGLQPREEGKVYGYEAYLDV